MTVEEILVKFTGDASSLTGASDKAKNKTKDLKEEVEKLDRIMGRAKMGTAGYEMTLAKLEKTTRKYADTLDKIKKQESKGGGGAGFGMFTMAGAASAVTSRLISIIEPQLRQVGTNFGSSLEQAVTGSSTSLLEAQRMQEREDDRAGYLAGLRNRGIGDANSVVDRSVAGRSLGIGIAAQEKRRNELLQQLAQSKNTIATFEKTMEKNDSVLSRSKQAAYAQAAAGLKEEIAHYKALESAAHAAGERIKDMQAQSWQNVQQQRQQLTGMGQGFAQQALLLANPDMDPAEIAMMNARKEVRDRIQALPNETQANKDKMMANELEQLEAQFRTFLIAKKEAFDMNFLRGQEAKVRAFGKTAAEAFLIQQKAIGKEVAPDRAEQILATEDKLRGLEITERFKTPYEKAMAEKEKLDAIRGELSAETYQRAMAEIDKGMRGPGPAASHTATGYGSAEHAARMYAYNQVMTQPATQQTNIDRLSREPSKTTDKQTEANNYLRSIRDAIKGKKTVEVQPANLGS